MIRKAFIMSVNAGCEQEYQRRHDELWPEMKELLKSHGAHNYSIHLDPASRQLFAYVEIDSEELWNQVAQTDVCRKWWQSMQPLMPSNVDGSPKAVELKEVFYLA